MSQSRTKWGQTVLEVCLTVMVTILLLLAIVSTWTYYTKNMVERMDEYKATRLAAADILGSQTGKRLIHRPGEFDIFGGYSVGEPTDFEDIGNYSQFCDGDSYRNANNLSIVLMNESAYYANLSNNATSDDMAYKGQLAVLNTYRSIYNDYPSERWWDRDDENPLVYMLYGTDYARVFSQTWDQIEERIDVVIPAYFQEFEIGHVSWHLENVAFGNSIRLYYWNNPRNYVPCLSGQCCIVDSLRNVIINPGRVAESKIAPTALKRDIMEQLSEMAGNYSKGYITPCAWRSKMGEEDACGPICSLLLSNINTTIQATASCVRRAANNNIAQVQNCRDNPSYLPSARSSLAAYENCYQNNCGRSPWAPWEGGRMDECYDTCRHFQDNAQRYADLAEQAFSRFDMDNYRNYSNLSMNMTWRFDICMEDEGCGERR